MRRFGGGVPRCAVLGSGSVERCVADGFEAAGLSSGVGWASFSAKPCGVEAMSQAAAKSIVVRSDFIRDPSRSRRSRLTCFGRSSETLIEPIDNARGSGRQSPCLDVSGVSPKVAAGRGSKHPFEHRRERCRVVVAEIERDRRDGLACHQSRQSRDQTGLLAPVDEAESGFSPEEPGEGRRLMPSIPVQSSIVRTRSGFSGIRGNARPRPRARGTAMQGGGPEVAESRAGSAP